MILFNTIAKVGTKLTLNAQKSPAQSANQRWVLTKEGYIALQNHPRYVIDVQKSLKEGANIVLADSTSKSFQKSNFAKWDLVPLSKPKKQSK